MPAHDARVPSVGKDIIAGLLYHPHETAAVFLVPLGGIIDTDFPQPHQLVPAQRPREHVQFVDQHPTLLVQAQCRVVERRVSVRYMPNVCRGFSSHC
jgi:hypothetical protein